MYLNGNFYYTNLEFGKLISKDDDWSIDINGLIHKKARSESWTREQMMGFWRQVCLRMKSYGVTNRYPLGSLVTLVRTPEYRYKHIPTTGNHGLQVLGPVKKKKGLWDKENCVKFRDEVSALMRDQGLVFSYEPTVLYMTSVKDSDESESVGSLNREVGESRVIVQ